VRALTSLATVVVACACVTSVAYAGGPGDVYNDFAADGKLSCNHSRADLEAVLRSGSLNQYGDPFTMARLKLAVRKQLAGSCRRKSGSRGDGTAGVRSPGGGSGQEPRAPGSPRQDRHSDRSKSSSPRQATQNRVASSGGDNTSFVARRGLIVGLLVAALAFGGWLTKHALAARD
jgi:hypothetical protein